MRVGHEAGEQPGGGAAVPEQRGDPGALPAAAVLPHLRGGHGRRRDADLAGAAVRALERGPPVRPAAGLAGGDPGGLAGEESADGRRGLAGDGFGDGGEERARRGAVARQALVARRRHRAVRGREAVHGRSELSVRVWSVVVVVRIAREERLPVKWSFALLFSGGRQEPGGMDGGGAHARRRIL